MRSRAAPRRWSALLSGSLFGRGRPAALRDARPAARGGLSAWLSGSTRKGSARIARSWSRTARSSRPRSSCRACAPARSSPARLASIAGVATLDATAARRWSTPLPRRHRRRGLPRRDRARGDPGAGPAQAAKAARRPSCRSAPGPTPRASGSATRAARRHRPRPVRGGRLVRAARGGGDRRDRLRRRRAADEPDPGHDPVRRRRRPAAGRARRGRRRGGRARRSAASASPARSASTCRPCRRDRRQAAAAAVDAILPQPFERTAVNGFGFLQIVRRRERPSLPELLQADPAGAAARALLRARRAADRRRSTHPRRAHGRSRAIEPSDWLAALERRVGGAVALRAEPGLAISAGHVQSRQA